MGVYERLLRPIAFRFDPEQMHHCSIWALRAMGAAPLVPTQLRRHLAVNDPRLASDVCGLHFENPIGLAAGYDKNGAALGGLAALGFGFLEIGSISAESSIGNPKPRLFRLPEKQAIIVHYGLPNEGADAVVQRLQAINLPVPLGVNIVKTNKGDSEPADTILDDYRRSVTRLRSCCDYIVLNLSCPNTETGREFFGDCRQVVRLMEILRGEDIGVPLFLKISPLGGVAALDSLLEAVDSFSFISGFIFNLPPGKPAGLGLSAEQEQAMPGAVAGKPIEGIINEATSNLYQRMDRGRYRTIGVGGAFTAEDAYRKIRLGASLVQLLTALVYRGPRIVRTINEGLAELLERDGFSNVSDAVGADFA